MKRCDPKARAFCPDGETCELYAEFADGSWCDDFNKKMLNLPMTNADRIRTMSDRELAEVIMCPFGSEPDICCTKGTCLGCCMEWLRQPAEGSDGSAAGGGESDLSEWQRSADEEGAPSPTKMPGTATGERK